MTNLRQRLQEIWGDPVVRCPHHQVWWHDGGEDEKKVGHQEDRDLFWSKGKKYAPPKPPRERLA